jgi:hypothetical protein
LPKSRYDELHDKYFALPSSKAGTRYERLAAMVFKILHERDAVIHDLRLVGDSNVKHQIDVQLTVRGQRRRVIVECKDYDISGKKVGLDIIRNFWAVVQDTRADEGYIITCSAFTDDACRFAKAKNIRLAILRRHEEDDWAGYIRTVPITLITASYANVQASFFVPSETEKAHFAEAAKNLWSPVGGITINDPIYVVRDKEKVQFNEFIRKHASGAVASKDAPHKASVRVLSQGWKIQIKEAPPIAFDHVDISFDIRQNEMTLDVISNRIAELLLSGFGDHDLIIFGDQLGGRKIDPINGKVI